MSGRERHRRGHWVESTAQNTKLLKSILPVTVKMLSMADNSLRQIKNEHVLRDKIYAKAGEGSEL